jgi:hypothetical protein
MKLRKLLVWLLLLSGSAFGSDQLVLTAQYSDGEVVPYLLTTNTDHPKYAFIIMPGGDGIMNPRLDSNGNTAFDYGGNFLIRSRDLFAADNAVVAATNATSSDDRVLAIVKDIERRYGSIPIYVMGTSRSTLASMSLAKSMDGRLAGFIHTSSMSQVDWFNTKNLKSRQLLVHHEDDGCRLTPYRSAKSSSESYGTHLITVEDGNTTGDPRQAFGYHGFNGKEQEVVNQIKAWVSGK